MSAIIEDATGGAANGDLYRFVVIASPESGAPAATIGARGDTLLLDPMRAPDADLIGPFQPPIDGPEEIAIPRWAVYDCAEMPGAIIGVLREPIESPCDQPLDPVGLVLATPHAEPGDWHLYGLTVRRPGGPVDEVRASVVGAALMLLGARRVTLTVPWTSPLLGLLTRVGRVEVLAARTLLHGPGAVATVAVWGTDQCNGEPAEAAVPVGEAGLVEQAEAMLERGRRLVLVVRSDRGLCVAEVRA
ncbi:MAG: hypothetical protein IT431_13775 [Phycisphaerales bacterium]|nr:hypothetical protein [Phycisphaerales bacterium]